MSPSTRLIFLTFPQHWGEGLLRLRILALPRGNPLDAQPAGAPAFADANLKLAARLIPEPGKLPNSDDALAPEALVLTLPANRRTLLEKLKAKFNIVLGEVVEPAPASPPFQKYLPRSFRKVSGRNQPSRSGVVDDQYWCALKAASKPSATPLPQPSVDVSWGDVLHYALRQPLLAREIGLLFETDLPVPAGHAICSGGWIYTELAAGSDFAIEAGANPDFTASYAARIPALDGKRNLFSANLYAVTSGAGVPPVDDDVLTETEEYQDGFARLVHGTQPSTSSVTEDEEDPLPAAKDFGIRLGWDDEQILVWLNRQALADSNAPGHTPLGVAGYRVDVRLANSGAEFSPLTAVRGTLDLDGIALGTFDGELNVETVPVQFPNDNRFWLPAYLTAWAGESLVVPNAAADPFDGRPMNERPRRPYVAVGTDAVELHYGSDYEFRVRLADLSGGGPPPKSKPDGPGRVSPPVPFRRLIQPKAPALKLAPGEIVQLDTASFKVLRPRLGYPEAVFTNAAGALGQLAADVPMAKTEGREASIPDPDTTVLEVRVDVRAPAGDPAPDGYRTLYTAERAFPAQPEAPLQVDLDFADIANIALLPAPGPGPIPIPTARDVRISFTAICAPRPNYYGSEEHRRGVAPLVVNVRKESTSETGLLKLDSPGRHIRALFFQPDSIEEAPLRAAGLRHEAPSAVGSRLAEETDLEANGLTLFGRKGHRMIIGCSAALRHVIAPDKSAIQFASRDDLGRRWILAVQAELARDWTWDGIEPVAFRVLRSMDGREDQAGIIEITRAVSPVAVEQADRSRSSLCFFDAIDPKVEDGKFPEEIHVKYWLAPVFRNAAPVILPAWELRLPVSTQPLQTPKLKSAGIAFSKYIKAGDYSSTESRRRRLWVEFDQPPADTRDRYFCRVLAHAFDPMLTGTTVPGPPTREEPLPIDPEPVRVILPAQPEDQNGLNAMQPLLPGEGNITNRFLVPLPPGLNEDSPELFGMFTYEFRLGHDAQRWSTARGRFGPPLRVTGVQHPAPALACYVRRRDLEMEASAPFATAVQNGFDFSDTPATEIWFLLYAQVREASGVGWRNVLLTRKRGRMRGNAQIGEVRYSTAEISLAYPGAVLKEWSLTPESPLSVLAVELIPVPLIDSGNNRYADPLGADLGQVRILRTSPLVPVPPAC